MKLRLKKIRVTKKGLVGKLAKFGGAKARRTPKLC